MNTIDTIKAYIMRYWEKSPSPTVEGLIAYFDGLKCNIEFTQEEQRLIRKSLQKRHR